MNQSVMQKDIYNSTYIMMITMRIPILKVINE